MKTDLFQCLLTIVLEVIFVISCLPKPCDSSFLIYPFLVPKLTYFIRDEKISDLCFSCHSPDMRHICHHVASPPCAVCNQEE